jgi:hypothetical protein
MSEIDIKIFGKLKERDYKQVAGFIIQRIEKERQELLEQLTFLKGDFKNVIILNSFNRQYQCYNCQSIDNIFVDFCNRCKYKTYCTNCYKFYIRCPKCSNLICQPCNLNNICDNCQDQSYVDGIKCSYLFENSGSCNYLLSNKSDKYCDGCLKRPDVKRNLILNSQN